MHNLIRKIIQEEYNSKDKQQPTLHAMRPCENKLRVHVSMRINYCAQGLYMYVRIPSFVAAEPLPAVPARESCCVVNGYRL